MKASAQAKAKLKKLEGLRLVAYRDVGGVWTIGYGHIQGVREGDSCTEAQADNWLWEELGIYEETVTSACTVEPTQNQFDAMVLLCYNIGMRAFRNSTVLKAHNRGDFISAARAFGLWNKVKGRVVAGLTARRAAEAAMYLEDIVPQPQESSKKVDREKPMRHSTINLAGTTATVVAAGTGAQQALEVVNGVKSSTKDLGDWLAPMLILAVACLCAFIVYERFQQRKKGKA